MMMVMSKVRRCCSGALTNINYGKTFRMFICKYECMIGRINEDDEHIKYICVCYIGLCCIMYNKM